MESKTIIKNGLNKNDFALLRKLLNEANILQKVDIHNILEKNINKTLNK